jgi:two-component system chemotaxis sensor kinase CheA
VEIGIQEPVQADVSPDDKQSPKNKENPKPNNVIREDSIKVSADKLDSVLNASSEVYITRIRLENDQKHLTDAINRMHEDIQGLGKELDKRLTKSSSDAAKEKGSHARQRKVGEGELKYFEHNGLTEPLLGTQSDLLIGVERLSIQNKNIQKNIEDLEVLSSRLQSGAMNFRMVPISNLFNRFPAQVRDIARQIGKRVELRISGAETELDKILINQLADPLLHLIRNSIDHGIENPQTRTEMKKGEVGQIDLRAYYLGSNAIIEIEDDGKGIDANVILKKAIEKGLIADGQRTDILEKEIFDFIFEPGFSSAEKVTELSGRGVGMDVVKTSISRMQGSIKVQSKVNSGTVVTLRLPLTLAVVGILLVSENGYEFAFPILNVDEVIHINLTKDIKRINETLVYNFRSELVPVNYLSDFLDYPKNTNQTGDNFLLILNDGALKRVNAK